MSNTEALQAWAAEILPIVQAIVDGYEVECRLVGPELRAFDWFVKSEPGFSPDSEYRIKVKTRCVNGFTVPAPEEKPIKQGEVYYLPFLTKRELVECYHWDDVEEDHRLLRMGMVFKTKEAAQQNAQAMIGINPSAPEDRLAGILFLQEG